ncbi:MAG: hypothetical protein ACREYB_12105 [Casimicrobiaceae bacterium]
MACARERRRGRDGRPIGWLPIAFCVPLFDPHPLDSLAHMSGTAWFAVLYNILFAGTIAHWAWFNMARSFRSW